jgi:CheY-like chemotaxis protein
MEQQEEQKKESIKRALLVEDYEACQRFMSIYLQNLGYQVDLVDDSLTAIQKIQSKTYDLIIEDVNLHGSKSGEKVTQAIRESELNIDTPLIVWTAYANKNDEEKYLSWGADGALKKACGIEGLKKSIAKCLLKAIYKRSFYFQYGKKAKEEETQVIQ